MVSKWASFTSVLLSCFALCLATFVQPSQVPQSSVEQPTYQIHYSQYTVVPYRASLPAARVRSFFYFLARFNLIPSRLVSWFAVLPNFARLPSTADSKSTSAKLNDDVPPTLRSTTIDCLSFFSKLIADLFLAQRLSYYPPACLSIINIHFHSSWATTISMLQQSNLNRLS